MNWQAVLGLAAIVLLTGCNPRPTPPQHKQPLTTQPDTDSVTSSSSYPAVISETSVYYTGGPQQGRPPEGEFIKGTRVQVLENAGSYSIVRSADGIEAYVSTDAINPAPEKTAD